MVFSSGHVKAIEHKEGADNMAKNEGGVFWGVLLAAAAAAIAGAVALTRSFRSAKDGGGSWKGQPQGKDEPGPDSGKAGPVHPGGRQ